VTDDTVPQLGIGAADLEYDLAHETQATGPAAAPSQLHEQAGALVETETSDSASDYSYDLAHDIPRQRPRPARLDSGRARPR
jgi:hypothetical protein